MSVGDKVYLLILNHEISAELYYCYASGFGDEFMNRALGSGALPFFLENRDAGQYGGQSLSILTTIGSGEIGEEVIRDLVVYFCPYAGQRRQRMMHTNCFS